MAKCWWRIALLFAVGLAWPALAAPKTHIHLVLSAETARAGDPKWGDTIWAGLEMDMPPTWHVYWRNGGDAGDPVKITWKLPDGLSAGEIKWPVPEKEVDQAGDTPLVTYVYKGKVVLLTPIKLADSLHPGPLTLTAAVHWMECSDICVMQEGDVSAMLNIGAETKPSADDALIEQWRTRLPRGAAPGEATAFWQSSQVVSNTRPVVIEWKDASATSDFYPYASADYTVDGATQTLNWDGRVIQLRKLLTKNDNAAWPNHLTGILVGLANSVPDEAVEVSVPIKPSTSGGKEKRRPNRGGRPGDDARLRLSRRADLEHHALRSTRHRAENP